MRVLQLIDSLRPGGAEKMSVTYADALAKRIERSYLCCTRLEGMLKGQLSPEVGYLFLDKKNALDIQAFWKLRKYVKNNRIDLIQAHSSSWFLGVLVKLSLPQVVLVWHDHYGRALENRKPGVLKLGSKYFDGIISVNKNLQQWAEENLSCRRVRYFPNFLSQTKTANTKDLNPFGNFAASFKIICVANLRPQKDHLSLLKAFHMFSEEKEEVSLHLVGKHLEDNYSEEIKRYIGENKLKGKVFLHGEQQEISPFLAQADVGVLSSTSEGLPVALLEYGMAGLPVICTKVGECEQVIGEDGILISPGNPQELAAALQQYFDNPTFAGDRASRFQKKIQREYSEEAILPEVLSFFKQLELQN